jgi:hypothetical protein
MGRRPLRLLLPFDDIVKGGVKVFDRIDRAYYEGRAREEIEKAENCLEPCAKRTHLGLAAHYHEKLRELSSEAA